MIEEIPGLAKYLPMEVETADLVSKTIPPTKCKIKKGAPKCSLVK